VSFLSIYMTSCSYEHRIKDEGVVNNQRDRFNRLCKEKDRSVIYKTTKVNGFLSASRDGGRCVKGWDDIFKHGYEYAECTTSRVRDRKLPENAIIYQFKLEAEGHPDCGTDEKHFTHYSVSYNPYSLNRMYWL